MIHSIQTSLVVKNEIDNSQAHNLELEIFPLTLFWKKHISDIFYLFVSFTFTFFPCLHCMYIKNLWKPQMLKIERDVKNKKKIQYNDFLLFLQCSIRGIQEFRNQFKRETISRTQIYLFTSSLFLSGREREKEGKRKSQYSKRLQS